MKPTLTVQTVNLGERSYIVTRYNTGRVRIAVMTRKGPRVLTDRTTTGLIARIMHQADLDLQMASTPEDNTTQH